MKFKVGDKIICIDRQDGMNIVVNRIYTVSRYRDNCTFVELKELPACDYNEKYFELVERTLPKQVFFNDKKKTTVLKWEDNSITKVKCHDDEFDERVGFLIAYFQNTCGLSKNKANKYLDSLVPDDKPMEENQTPIEILDFGTSLENAFYQQQKANYNQSREV